MAYVSASLLSIKEDYIEQIKALDQTDVDFLHIDVLDGKFVDNKAFSIAEIKKIIEFSAKPLDVHLMVTNPKKYIDSIALYNIEYITFHYEIEKNLDELIKQVNDYGIKCGLSIKPKTPVKDILHYLNKINMVLIMSVEPGYGGQSFLEDSLTKIKELRSYSDNIVIAVDGGLDEIRAKECIKEGADILVVGSFLINSNNYQETIDKLRKKE